MSEMSEQKKPEEMNGLLQKYNERVKELNCVYGVAKIIEQPGATLEEIL